jgi:hypothetical protein
MKKTEVKAIEMIRRIREAHYEQLQGKTHEEQMAFYRAKAQQMNTRVKAMLSMRQPSAEVKS